MRTKAEMVQHGYREHTRGFKKGLTQSLVKIPLRLPVGGFVSFGAGGGSIIVGIPPAK